MLPWDTVRKKILSVTFNSPRSVYRWYSSEESLARAGDKDFSYHTPFPKGVEAA